MLFGGYEGARLVHFFAMAAIVLFLVLHVVMALLVPKSLRAMITGRLEHEAPREPSKASIAGLLLRDAAKLLPDPSRRLFLRNTASLGALALLTGCDIVDGPSPPSARCAEHLRIQ